MNPILVFHCIEKGKKCIYLKWQNMIRSPDKNFVYDGAGKMTWKKPTTKNFLEGVTFLMVSAEKKIKTWGHRRQSKGSKRRELGDDRL